PLAADKPRHVVTGKSAARHDLDPSAGSLDQSAYLRLAGGRIGSASGGQYSCESEPDRRFQCRVTIGDEIKCTMQHGRQPCRMLEQLAQSILIEATIRQAG